jgi:hypothetical protein
MNRFSPLMGRWLRRLALLAASAALVALASAPAVGWAAPVLPGEAGQPVFPDQAPAAPAGLPPDCGPQHHVGAYSAGACMPVNADGVLWPDAYVTIPAGRNNCQVVFTLFHHDGSQADGPFSSTETQPCRAGNNVHYTPTQLQGTDPAVGGNDLQLVVDVIDDGITKVIADSPVETDHGRLGGVSPATGNDAVATTGPGDGKGGDTQLFCHALLVTPAGKGLTSLDVSTIAHRNGDGTVASVDAAQADAEIGGLTTPLTTVRDSKTWALIANGGHSLELHTHATITYGVGLKGIGSVGAPVPVDCNAYYTF